MAASLRKIDTWGESSIQFDGNVIVELTRVATIIDLDGPDALMEATGTPGIPAPWDAFAGHPEMRVIGYEVRPQGGRIAEVYIRYANKTYKKVRGGNAPEIVQRDYNVSGNQIQMVYQGATYVGVVSAIAPRPIKTIQRIEPQRPYEGGVNIELVQAAYMQSVNLYSWYGDPGGYWMCESVDYESIGTVAYDVTYTFRGRNGYPPSGINSGWLARTVPREDNGDPIAGAPPLYSQIYTYVDFGPLDLEP